MVTFYEELIAKGLDTRKLPLELAWTTAYQVLVDELIGTDNISFKTIQLNEHFRN